MIADAETKPMLETILKRIDELENRLNDRLERIETLLDRTASVTYETRAEVRELKKYLREHLNLPV